MKTRASRTTSHDRSGSWHRALWMPAPLVLMLTLVLAAGACSSTTGSDTIATKSASPDTATSNETTVGTQLASATEGTAAPAPGGTDPDRGDGTTVPTSQPTTSVTGSKGSTTTTYGDTPGGPGSPTSNPKSTVTVTVTATPDNQAFCQTFAAFVEAPISDMSDVNKVLAQYKTMFQKLTSLAPPAIAADWQAINAPIQAATDLQAFQAAGSDPAFLAATDRISAWTATNCGFDPNKGSSSSSSSGSTGSSRTKGTSKPIR